MEGDIGSRVVGLDAPGEQAVKRERLVIAARHQALDHVASDLLNGETPDDQRIEAVEGSEQPPGQPSALRRVRIGVGHVGEIGGQSGRAVHRDRVAFGGLRRTDDRDGPRTQRECNAGQCTQQDTPADTPKDGHWRPADLIRKCSPPSFTTGVGIRPRQTSKMPVGIDLFVGRCIEGGRLNTVGTPVTYPPQLPRRQPRKRLGFGACSGFGCSRSERVFRNEFPYLGRFDPAAWAGFRLAGGLGAVGRLDRFERQAQQPAPAPGAPKSAHARRRRRRPRPRPLRRLPPGHRLRRPRPQRALPPPPSLRSSRFS